MKRLQQTPPVIWLNRLLANVWFIVLINVVFLLLFFCNLPDNKINDAMSWFTMVMDQVIISAGWVIYLKNLKFMNEERARLKRIDKLLLELAGKNA